MSGLPVRYVHQNILVGHGEARAALFRVATISYPFMAGARQARVAAAAGALRVLGGGRLLAVARQPRLPRRALRRAGARGCSTRAIRTRRRGASYLAGHEAHLRRLRSFVPEVYLAVSLEPERPSQLGAGLLRGLDRARRRVEELLGVGAAAADRRRRRSRR